MNMTSAADDEHPRGVAGIDIQLVATPSDLHAA